MTAAVIDPRPNVDIYLELAREQGVAITHVFKTHIHVDVRNVPGSWQAWTSAGYEIEKS